jgi:3-dehydroquinate dehydratase II
MYISVINGPNLNLIGQREKHIYGDESMAGYVDTLRKQFPHIRLEYYQSNIEGEIVNRLHDCGFKASGIILNAGAYSHTSLAIGDAVAAVPAPVVEVHISNVYSREDFRHKSFISAHAAGIITGFGLDGYTLALVHLISKMQLQ